MLSGMTSSAWALLSSTTQCYGAETHSAAKILLKMSLHFIPWVALKLY